MTDPSRIPSGGFLAGISSVAGASGLNPTGWVHQNGVSEHSDGSIVWQPQDWSGGGPHYLDNPTVGRYNWVAFHLRTDIANGVITYKCYAYWRPDQYSKHFEGAIIYTQTAPTSDNNFLVGRTFQTQWSRWVKFFQFGVESSQALTNWEVANKKPCYYTGTSWYYWPGYMCQGDASQITWDSSGTYRVGGAPYLGSNIDYVASDFVVWNWTGTTIATDSQLWSGSGIVTDCVDRPYEVT